MRLGIMQPYFLPYLGYFDLINSVDKWLVLDTTQYIKHGWIHRNRILHPNEGWNYIIVPTCKHSLETPITDVEVTPNQKWRKRILGQIQFYKKHAPYFTETKELLEECFAFEDTSISRLNVNCLNLASQRLNISFDYEFLSEMELKIPASEDAASRILNINKALGANEYINAPGGKHLYDEAKFEKHGIKLKFRQLPPMEYDCGQYEFIPNLSIVDVLMWNSPEEIKAHLDKYA